MMAKFSLTLPIPHNNHEEDMAACMKQWGNNKEKMRKVDWESYYHLYCGIGVLQNQDGNLVIRDESTKGNPGTAIRFIQHYLNWFNLSQGVVLSWADVGVYRGGAALVTREDVAWFEPEAMASSLARAENIQLIGESR